MFQLPVLVFFACFSASKHTSWVFSLVFTRYTQITLHFPGSASGFGFFHLFFGFQTHFVGFFACFLLATHRLLSTFPVLLPVLCFFARFSAFKHTSCVFLLAFRSLHTDCSPLSRFCFRFWVFSPVSRLSNILHGFFCLFFTRYTQIALHFPDLASGFGFFHLFFGFQTHFVGFFACFLLATHRLLSTFPVLLPVLCFFARFSAFKHTSCVFLLAFRSLHTDCSPLSRFCFRFWVFSPVSRLSNTPRGFFSACFLLATHIHQCYRHAPIRLLTEQQFSMLCLPA